MIINIITVNRKKKNYIQDTLQYLLESDWRDSRIAVNLLIGSDDESYLESYRNQFNIVSWNLGNHQLTKSFDLNYLRALRYGEDDVLICEDDIQLSKSWYRKLCAAIEEIPLERYVLSLYSPSNFGHKCYNRGKYYRSYAASQFYGTQCIYYPANTRKEAANFLAKQVKEIEDPKPADVILNRFFTENDFLYLTQPTLAQHKGRESTGLGTFHSAWNFDPN